VSNLFDPSFVIPVETGINLFLFSGTCGHDASCPYTIITKNLKLKAKNHNSKFKTFFRISYRVLRSDLNDKKRQNLQSGTYNYLLVTYYSLLFLSVFWLLTSIFLRRYDSRDMRCEFCFALFVFRSTLNTTRYYSNLSPNIVLIFQGFPSLINNLGTLFLSGRCTIS